MDVVSPKGTKHDGTPRKRWEHQTVRSDTENLEQDKSIVLLGLAGWEVVGVRMVTHKMFLIYLKREL